MNSATYGKIAGAIGLLAFLSSSYTYFITTGSPWLAGTKAIVGLALIGLYFATNYKQFGQFASRKSTSYVLITAVMTLFVIGALTAVNFIAAKKGKSWDLTSKKIYTLAPQTVSTLKELREPVKAIGFLASNNPVYEPLQQLFERYHREAPDKFDYVFKDPKKNPDLAAKYELKEGQATVVLTRGEGAKETHTSLNIVSEQELTNALVKINQVGEQKVYFVLGHGEWPVDQELGDEGAGLKELFTSLKQEGYSPEALNLAGKTEIPKDAALLVVAGPKSKLADPEVKLVETYLEQGGRLAALVEPDVVTGLEKLLQGYGVQLDSGILADNKFAVGSPYVIMSMFYGQHEIADMLKRLQLNVQLPTARGLTVLKEGLLPGVTPTAVVLTSPYAWEESTPNNSPEPSDGEKSGQIPVVVATSRNTAQAKDKRFDEARVVVFGDSELVVDANWGLEPNRNLVMNAFAWATNQTQKITIRPPDRDISTIELDNATMAKVRFVATDLLPMSLLGLGLAIWLTRRNK